MQNRMRKLNECWLELMRDGRFEEAWRVSDEVLTLRARVDCSRWPRHEQFIWRGQNVCGQRVLVRCYHGLGDTLQYLRLLEPLRLRALHITLWMQPELICLAQGLSYIDRIVPLHEGAP